MDLTNALKIAKETTEKIDALMLTLGTLITASRSEKDADEIFAMIENTTNYMFGKQCSGIWDYLVDWENIGWVND